jgi:hypothetical protein
MNAPSDLCREFVEALRAEHAGLKHSRCRQRRRYGKVEPSLKRDRLAYDSQVTIK